MAARGGRYHWKMGKMHQAGVHGKGGHRKAAGGEIEPDADDMASGGKTNQRANVGRLGANGGK